MKNTSGTCPELNTPTVTIGLLYTQVQWVARNNKSEIGYYLKLIYATKTCISDQWGKGLQRKQKRPLKKKVNVMC